MTEAKDSSRGRRSTVVGTVVSSKMKDTITVREERSVKHPLYGKYVRRATKYYAHDAGNTAREGDVVELVETRPMSKTKRWRLVRVVRRSEGGLVHSDADAAAAARAEKVRTEPVRAETARTETTGGEA